MLTVQCVFKREPSERFTVDDVHRLASGVRRYLTPPYKFVCRTDADPAEFDRGLVDVVLPLEFRWRGWWSKMEVFSSVGPTFYMDLDTVVVGDIDPVVDAVLSQEGPTFLRGFYRGEFASGIFGWPGDVRRLFMKFVSDVGEKPKYIVTGSTVRIACRSGRYRGDQNWIDQHVRGKIPFTWLQDVADGVYSYKVHIVSRETLPEDARIVCFHGVPRPVDVDPAPAWLSDAMKIRTSESVTEDVS